MNSTTSEGRSASASAAQSQSRLQPPIIQHVLTAIDTESITLPPMVQPTSNIAVQPRSLLALLIYHYAQGTLASHDIESTLWTEPQLRLLCRDRLPNWRELRRFRRLHHEVVHDCLAQVLAQKNCSTPTQSSASDEAEQRLSEAAFLDNLFADE